MNPFSAPPINLGRRWKVSIGAGDVITCGEVIDSLSSLIYSDEQKRNLKKILLDPNTTLEALRSLRDGIKIISPSVADCIDSIIADRTKIVIPPASPPVMLIANGGGGANSESSSASNLPLIVAGTVFVGSLAYIMLGDHSK